MAGPFDWPWDARRWWKARAEAAERQQENLQRQLDKVDEDVKLAETVDAGRREALANAEAANAAKDAALRHIRDCPWTSFAFVNEIRRIANAALSDTGEGWLPPEVREPAIRALRFESSLTVHSQFHLGYRDGSQQDCPSCRDARAALDALGEK